MKKGTNTERTNWHVFMECHTSAIVMKEIHSIEGFLSAKNGFVLWSPSEVVLTDSRELSEEAC